MPLRGRMLWPVAAAGILIPSLLGYVYLWEAPPPAGAGPAEAADPAVVHDFCTRCHAYPAPDSFPRSAWRPEIAQAYQFMAEAGLTRSAPPAEAVLRYFEAHSPEELPPPALPADSHRLPVRFDRQADRLPGPDPRPIVTCVRPAAALGTPGGTFVTCDARTHQILAADLGGDEAVWRPIGTGSYPARVTVTDLDRDGVPDVLVSNMGVHFPSDDLAGSVVWLRGRRDGGYDPPVVLLGGVGRVTDVQPLDADGDGDTDLVVAVFGWRKTGEVVLLRNRTEDWAAPRFEPEVVDRRHGAIEVPVADLNGDGKPDFVAVFGQEHEQVVAFLNDGLGHFRPVTLYAAPLPSFGSSGIVLVDVDGDGDLDILYPNGDSLDPPPVLKPYHGVQWLENVGGERPFVPHRIGYLPGVMAATAADFDGDGDIDFAAVAYLPASAFPDREARRLPAVVLYEQTAPGTFAPHVLERGACDHLACAAAVLPGDRLPSLVVSGGCFMNKTRPLPGLTVWRNRGKP
ncbi:MAG: VCBS repeat-containing protein [Gemmataceae bacterium]|nr:VCBS repeat-containing protein [Gemmataceae bacterium]